MNATDHASNVGINQNKNKVRQILKRKNVKAEASIRLINVKPHMTK